MANNRELSQFGAFVEVNSTNGKIGLLTDFGIGTSNPLHKLDVNGEVGVSPNTAGKSTHVFTTNATDDGRYLLKSDTTTKVDIQANGLSYFNGGNVGFGITTPTQKIHVDGTVLATQLSTGASGTGINVTTNSITGPATITIDPAAVGDDTGTVEIKGNLTVQGTTTTINSSTVTFNQISLGDNEKIQIGDSNDLEIYHDGSNSYIRDLGTGNLVLTASSIHMNKADNGEALARFNSDSDVALFYNNNIKFATTSTGVTVTGTVVADGLILGDNESINIGNSSDIRIYHDGTDSYIKAQGTGENLRVFTVSGSISLQKGSSAEENMLVATADGAVELYYDNNKKFETSATGATITGTLVADGVSLGDNEYITIGEGNDLQLYHTGTNSYIDDTATGNLNIRSNGSYITLGTISGETMISAKTDGNVELFYDNNKKFETTTSGVTVTGGVNLNSVALTETITATVATTTTTAIDSFAAATYRSAKYHIQITQGTNYQTSEVLVIHDGTTADIIEYGSIATNDYLGTFSATVAGGNVSLNVTMTSATSAAVKILANLIVV